MSSDLAQDTTASLEDASEKGPVQVPVAESLDANSGLAVDPLSSVPARTICCVQLPLFRSHGGSGAKVGYKLCAITSKNVNGDLAHETMQVPDELWPPEAFVIMIEHAVPDLAKELLVGDILTFYHGDSDIPSLEYRSTPHAVLPCGAEVMSVFPLYQYWMYEVHFPASYHSLVTCIMESLPLGFRTFSQTSEEAQTSLCSKSSLNLRRSQLTSDLFSTSDFEFPAYSTTASHLDNVIHKTCYYPMSNFASPASFMTASSPASFMTARSTYASPAWSTAMGLSPASVMTRRSMYTSPAYGTSGGLSPTMRVGTIREDEPADSTMPAPLKNLRDDYFAFLHQEDIVQPFEKELNWSGKGQHVTFLPEDSLPLTSISHLGASLTAKVDKVLCRRIALARKTMRCSRPLSLAEALLEVYHLQNLRHPHIVQLVGSYLQGRDFSILMYPVADCHLGTFLEDTADLREARVQHRLRSVFLKRSFACLTSAIAYIHKNTTKHMDIKPQNILVRALQSEGTSWQIYLADFGLSRRFTSQDHSQTDGPTSYTARYCAPEVFRYECRGRSADIFSLGSVFIEIMTVINTHSPQEFADFRRGEGTDESFHANLPRVVQWLEDKCTCETHWALTGISTRDIKTPHGFDLLEKYMVMKMVEYEPAARPTAQELQQLPKIFATYDCCRSTPEPYVAYEVAES